MERVPNLGLCICKEKLVDSMLAETTQALHDQSPVLKTANALGLAVIRNSSHPLRDHCADGIVSSIAMLGFGGRLSEGVEEQVETLIAFLWCLFASKCDFVWKKRAKQRSRSRSLVMRLS